jgi:hypothetical protein
VTTNPAVVPIIDFTIMSRARGCERRRSAAVKHTKALEVAHITNATLAHG